MIDNKFILIPIFLLIFSFAVLIYNYNTTGEFLTKGIELKGGNLLTLKIDGPIDINKIDLSEFGSTNIRSITGLSGNSLLIQFEQGEPENLMKLLESNDIEILSYSIEYIGPALGKSFWRQTVIALIMAFCIMGIIVFFIFRTPLPSCAVIFSALSDIIITLAFMQIFGIRMSFACLAALLMLIGYSVDTDILLTTKILKRAGNIKEKFEKTLKTGLMMSLTTLGSLTAMYIVSTSAVLCQIAGVLIIGILIDIINTWFMNSIILCMWAGKK